MPDSSNAELRLTRRGRAVLVVFAASFTLLALWLTVGPGALAVGHRGTPHEGRTVVVGPGDTLWEIASDVDPEADPRLIVQRIIDLNGLGGDPTVQPGQELRVPVG